MNPQKQQLATMDPQLKAAYDAVMSKPLPDFPATQTPGIVPAPGLSNTTSAQTIPQPKMIAEEKIAQQTTITPPHMSASFIPPAKPATATNTIHIGYGVKPGGQKIILEKKRLGIPPALYILGCILFFIFYAIFWIKVFGVKIPYLP